MLDFLKRKKNQPMDDTPKSSNGLVDRWKQGLSYTRQVFSAKLLTLLKASQPELDQTLLENLEDFLLESDIGFALSESLIKDLKKKIWGADCDRSNNASNFFKATIIHTIASLWEAFSWNKYF